MDFFDSSSFSFVIKACNSPFDTYKLRCPALFENSRDKIPSPPPPPGNASNGYVRTVTYRVRTDGTVQYIVPYKNSRNLYCEERQPPTTWDANLEPLPR